MLHNDGAGRPLRRPRLMALLLDLPPTPRRRLAERWETEDDAAAIYRAMTDPAGLVRLSRESRLVLAALAQGAASRAELAAALPIGDDRVAATVEELTLRGLALRPPERDGRVPRLAIGAAADEQLYLPADVAAAFRLSIRQLTSPIGAADCWPTPRRPGRRQAAIDRGPIRPSAGPPPVRPAEDDSEPAGRANDRSAPGRSRTIPERS